MMTYHDWDALFTECEEWVNTLFDEYEQEMLGDRVTIPPELLGAEGVSYGQDDEIENAQQTDFDLPGEAGG